MTSSRDKIVHNIDQVITAIGALAGELKTADELDLARKELAISKLAQVALQLKDLHTELFHFGGALAEVPSFTCFEEEVALLNGAAPNGMIDDEAVFEEESPEVAIPLEEGGAQLGGTPLPAQRGAAFHAEDDDEPAETTMPAPDWAARANNLQLIDGIDGELEAQLQALGVY